MPFDEPDFIDYMKLVLSDTHVIQKTEEETCRLDKLIEEKDPDMRIKAGNRLFFRRLLVDNIGDSLKKDAVTMASCRERLGGDYIPMLSRLRVVFSTSQPVPEIKKTIEDRKIHNYTRHRALPIPVKACAPAAPAEPLVLDDVPADMTFDCRIVLPTEMQMLLLDRHTIYEDITHATNEVLQERLLDMHNVYEILFRGYVFDKVHAFVDDPQNRPYRFDIENGWVLHLVDLAPPKKKRPWE